MESERDGRELAGFNEYRSFVELWHKFGSQEGDRANGKCDKNQRREHCANPVVHRVGKQSKVTATEPLEPVFFVFSPVKAQQKRGQHGNHCE